METEEERRIRRLQRIEEMKRAKSRTERLYKAGAVAASALAILIGIGIGVGTAMFSHRGAERQDGSSAEESNFASSGEGESLNEEQDGGKYFAQEESLNDSGQPETKQKRKGGRGRKEEFDILRASRSIPISGTAVTGVTSMEEGGVPQEDVISEAPEEISGLEDGLTSVRTPVWAAHETAETGDFGEEVISEYGILVDVWDGSILSEKRARERMNPASMTKVLTVLVAAEHLTEEDMDRTERITLDITDYCFSNDCSIAGYDLDEEATVRDLFYGTILPSGADAALALAKYVAGSHEAFVDMMNEKLEEMGLSETTHFTNCVGLYDENHYTTAYDMAVILKVAADNEFCREVLSRQVYYTVPTEQHPEGLMLVNWFLRRIGDRETHGTVLCAKTGFVDEAGSCAASLSVGDNGREYICVTGASTGTWNCIADQETLYRTFLPEVPSGEE